MNCLRPPRALAVVAVVALLAGLTTACGDGARTRPPNDIQHTELPQEATASVADGATHSNADVAELDVSAPEVPDTESELPDVAPGINLVVEVTAPGQSITDPVKLVLLPAATAAMFDAGQAVKEGGDLVAGEQLAGPVWPLTFAAQVPEGSWVVLAVVGTPPVLTYLSTACEGAAAKVFKFGPGQPAVQTAKLVLQPVSAILPPSQLCQQQVGQQSVLEVTDLVEMQATKNGRAHYLRGLRFGDHMWIADSQDGFVLFDFGPNGGKDKLHGWQTPGGDGCIGIARYDKWVFCGTRSGLVKIATLLPGKGTPTVESWSLSAGNGLEGAAVQQKTVWFAAHGAGLRAMTASPPWQALKVGATPLKDAWDVIPLGAKRLVVADGTYGIQILDVDKPEAPVVVGKLALAGLSTHLALGEQRLAVASSGAGVHLVDLADPTSPKWLETVALPSAPHGMAWQKETLVVAGGHHVFAIEAPTAGPAQVIAASQAKHFAVDEVPFLNEIISLEFQSVRRFKVTPQLGKAPLVAPPGVYVRTATVGETRKAKLRLFAPGAAATLQSVVVAETANVTKELPGGPWVVPAGGHLDVSVGFTKTVKGVQMHQILLKAAGQLPEAVEFNEVTQLRPGEPLPPLKYANALGQLVDVQGWTAGKPSLVLIAAQSCPAAFRAMVQAGVDLAPEIAAGKIAVVALNPWDKPDRPEVSLVPLPYPVLFSGLTTTDSHDWSELVQGSLGQPGMYGPPMPIVYVLDKAGVIVRAQWGYDKTEVRDSLGLD